MDPVPEAFYFVSLGVTGRHRWSSTMHMQPHSSSRTGRTLLCPPPPFVLPLAPPVICIGCIFQDWRRRALDTLGPHTLLHCFLTLKADFLKALTQGAHMCLPPSLWGRIHYNSLNPPLPTLYLFIECILGVKVNNVHLHQAFMQVHRHLKCKPPPLQKRKKFCCPNKTNISRVMIKIETAVPCRTSPERTAFRSLFNALRGHRRTCLATPLTHRRRRWRNGELLSSSISPPPSACFAYPA